MNAASPPSLEDRLLAGEPRALSRLITRVEAGHSDVLALMDRLWSRRSEAGVLGVTGPPGAGKSTLVDRYISRLRERGHKVAVLAVDPSSPFSGGAILGDRIRMQRHAADPGVFIRSLGTRGHHGGLSRATFEAATLCAAAGWDRVLIETVGVGQTELEVVGVADQVLVLLVPEAGDVVQTLKAGLLEGADLFAVNKADRPGADRLLQSLRSMLDERVALGDESAADITLHRVSASEGAGLDELFADLDERLDSGRVGHLRLGAAALAARIVGHERGRAAERAGLAALGSGGSHEALGVQLTEGRANPYAAARALLESGL